MSLRYPVSDLRNNIDSICREISRTNREFFFKLESALHRNKDKADFVSKMEKWLNDRVIFPSEGKSDHWDRIKAQLERFEKLNKRG